MSRWSEDWNSRSLERFAEKWGVDPDRGWPLRARRWAAGQRTRWYHGRGPVREIAGKAVRFSTRYPGIDPIARFGENKLMNRPAATERERRVAAGRSE